MAERFNSIPEASLEALGSGAAVLLFPYILWVTIASALNYYVWVLNA